MSFDLCSKKCTLFRFQGNYNERFSVKYDHRKWYKYVVNFNITLNGNTSKVLSDRKYTTFF